MWFKPFETYCRLSYGKSRNFHIMSSEIIHKLLLAKCSNLSVFCTPKVLSIWNCCLVKFLRPWRFYCLHRFIMQVIVHFVAEVLCSSPLPKRNAEMDNLLDSYGIGSAVVYRCVNYTWLSAQYLVTEWAFAGAVQAQIVCTNVGTWVPHPDSFACRRK